MHDKTSAMHARFMRLAIAKAREGVRQGQTPFGACIVMNGKVVACEHNLVWKNTDITSHAEICAIRKACRFLDRIQLEGCRLYSTCEPCPMCLSACHWAKISHIYFGSTIPDAKKLGFSELAISVRTMIRLGRSPLKSTGGILRKENLELFRSWAMGRQRRAY